MGRSNFTHAEDFIQMWMSIAIQKPAITGNQSSLDTVGSVLSAEYLGCCLCPTGIGVSVTATGRQRTEAARIT
ncbi:hypothetical protein [Nostoc sp.]|uniref:hypothetical protein n=1 Tax=Nostoc sp. TaxID=1180 RepID=UPI002FF8E81E